MLNKYLMGILLSAVSIHSFADIKGNIQINNGVLSFSSNSKTMNLKAIDCQTLKEKKYENRFLS